MNRRVLAVLGMLAATAVAPAAAQAPGLALTATAKPVGRIALKVKGPADATVALTDTTAAPRRLGEVLLDATGKATVEDAATWTCTTRRTFNGVTTTGVPVSADAEVRTPSCAHRYTLAVAKPKHARAGHPLRLRLTDAFRLDDQPVKACLTGPGGAKRCKPFEAGRVTITPTRPGRFRVKAKAPGTTIEAQHVTVRRKPGHITLLAAGDSQMQILDDFLADRLAKRHVTVHKDARISTGLSKPFMFDWPAQARKQGASLKPDVTVMIIGANDGFPFGDAQCCGKPWIKAYAKRVDTMIDAWSQNGSGSVYWCLLPAPRAANFRRVFVAVNAAIRKGVKRNPGVAHVVDLPKYFTPGYRFRSQVNGTTVRQDDGVHFNVTGASIAANIIRRQMIRDGVV